MKGHFSLRAIFAVVVGICAFILAGTTEAQVKHTTPLLYYIGTSSAIKALSYTDESIQIGPTITGIANQGGAAAIYPTFGPSQVFTISSTTSKIIGVTLNGVVSTIFAGDGNATTTGYLAASTINNQLMYYNISAAAFVSLNIETGAITPFFSLLNVGIKGVFYSDATGIFSWVAQTTPGVFWCQLSNCMTTLNQVLILGLGSALPVDLVYDDLHNLFYVLTTTGGISVVDTVNMNVKTSLQNSQLMGTGYSFLNFITPDADDTIPTTTHLLVSQIAGPTYKLSFNATTLVQGLLALLLNTLPSNGNVLFVPAAAPVVQPPVNLEQQTVFKDILPTFDLYNTRGNSSGNNNISEHTSIQFGNFASAGISFPGIWDQNSTYSTANDTSTLEYTALVTPQALVKINTQFSATQALNAQLSASTSYNVEPLSVKFTLNIKRYTNGTDLFPGGQTVLPWTVCYNNSGTLGAFNLSDVHIVNITEGVTQYRFHRQDNITDALAFVITIPTVVSIDGVDDVPQSHFMDVTQFSTTGISACFTWNFPYFSSSLRYDPDVGRLVDPGAGGDGQGGDGENGGSVGDGIIGGGGDGHDSTIGIIAGATVGGAIFLCIAVFVVIVIVVISLALYHRHRSHHNLDSVSF